MSVLPRVDALSRERIAREFDDRGPEACRAEIIADLELNNPELLDMAGRCARDVGDFPRIMTGFCMFYRLLSAAARVGTGTGAAGTGRDFSPLPRVSAATRAAIVGRIDVLGSMEFTGEAIAGLEHDNPELLLMSHNFATDQVDYGGVMQGFALLYACLMAEAAAERGVLH